jgi:ligand-binding sensor domain-containing protein
MKNVAPPSTKYPQLNAYTSYLDDNGNIWIGYEEGGIKIFNQQGLLIKKMDSSLPHLSIRCFEKGPGNHLFVGSTSGLFMIDTKNYAVDTFALQPTLAPMRHKKRLIDLLYHKNNLWMAVSPAGGVYKYDWQTRQLHKYDTSNGLISSRMYCLAVDQQDNVYAGSIHGLSIIKPNGEIFNLTKKNGLPGNRVESIISDNDGNLWFTTTKKVSKYVPAEKKIYVFDHRNGINEVLFNVVNATKTKDGTIFFPTTSGLVYFDPQKIKYYAEPQKLNVTGSTDGVNFQALKPDSTIRFAYDKGKITFMVSGSDAGNNTLLFYRYKMEGVDTGWSRPSRNRSIAYSLRPGRYRFLAEASFDLVNFFPSSQVVNIIVQKPLWQKAWFLVAVATVLIFSVWFIYRARIKALKQKSAIQQQLAELDGKALRAQMNPHFIFNSLNAIQESVVSNNIDVAYNYLSKFSRLLRMVLNNSEKELVSLQEEMEMLKIYLQLESLRFKESFTYEIKVGENIEPEMSYD